MHTSSNAGPAKRPETGSLALVRLELTGALFAALVMGGCSDSQGEVGALERALAKARPMHQVLEPALALKAPWDSPVPLSELVEHRLEVEMKVELRLGDAVHSLTIQRSIVRDGRRFRAIERRVHREPSVADPAGHNETSTRSEVVFDGERLATRRGLGSFIERDARDGLPARILTQLHDLTPSILAGFGDYLIETPSPGRAPEVGGLALSWHALSLESGVRARTMPAAELAALRDHEDNVVAWVAATFSPTRVAGRIGRGKTGVLDCDLSLAGGFRGPAGSDAGAVGGFTLELTQRVAAVNDAAILSLSERAPADFELPADRLSADRPRPWKMIEDVLGDGLLPPYRPQ